MQQDPLSVDPPNSAGVRGPVPQILQMCSLSEVRRDVTPPQDAWTDGDHAIQPLHPLYGSVIHIPNLM